MKSTIFTTLALASLAAAGWMGSFKYCRNNTTDTNPGCGTISFTENGCHQLPDSPQYNFTHNTHYIEASANVRCWGFGMSRCLLAGAGRVEPGTSKEFGVGLVAVWCGCVSGDGCVVW